MQSQSSVEQSQILQTASVFIKDNGWNKLDPHELIDQFRHNETGEDNADAHLPNNDSFATTLAHAGATGGAEPKVAKSSDKEW